MSQEAEEKALAVDRIRERYEHYAAIDASEAGEANQHYGDPLTRTYVEDVGLLLSVLSRE
jgi:hypothetical protein